MPIIDIHVGGDSERYPHPLGAYDDLSGVFAQMSVEAMTFWGLEWGKSRVPTLETYLANMKELGVDVLVYHALGNNPDSCRRLNDRTAKLCREYPDRLVGLATVPLPFPEEAVAEVERAIVELELRGLKIYPRAQKVPLDHASLLPVLARAAELDAPVLTHCTPLPIAYSGYYGPDVPIDNTSDNLARLFFSGVLSQIPRLKVIGAHLGGGMVFYKEFMEELNPEWESHSEGIYFDLSGYPFSEKMLRCAVDIVGEDHILFGSDFPVIGTEGIRKMLSRIRGFNLGKGVKDKILGANAARLLRMDRALPE